MNGKTGRSTRTGTVGAARVIMHGGGGEESFLLLVRSLARSQSQLSAGRWGETFRSRRLQDFHFG